LKIEGIAIEYVWKSVDKNTIRVDLEFACTECVSVSDELVIVGWDRFREAVRLPPQMKPREYWWVKRLGYFLAFVMSAVLIATAVLVFMGFEYKLMIRVFETWQLTLYTHMLSRDIPATSLLFA